jgi:YVTN family beta-propeller protein
MFSSRFKGSKLCAPLAVGALALLAAAPASARNAYVANSGDGTVSVLNADSNVGAGTVTVGERPVGVAVTPNGQLAYVTNEGAGTVSVISTASNAVVATIPLAAGSKPRGVAISPDGSTAWVADFGDETVTAIATATNTVSGAPVRVGREPEGVAVSPDGGSVFVAQKGGDVAILSAATRAETGKVVDPLGPSQLAIGPRGGRGYVTNGASNSVTSFNPANGQAGAPIAVGREPSGIAINPAGTLAYAAGFGDGTLTQIATATNAAAAPVGGFGSPQGVAVKPSGTQGYVANSAGGTVTVFDASTDAPLATIPVGREPSGVAIVPDQPPAASFLVTPQRRIQKRKLTFHGGGSKDPDGSIATYAWEFGDGKHVKGAKATVVHNYKRPGTYTATLTVTDSEGCSTEFVFTGQTASCNGSAVARTSQAIVVLPNRGPLLKLAGGHRQRLRGKAIVWAQCPQEACRVRAGGVVVTTALRRGARVSGKRKLGTARASLAAGQWARLAVPVRRGARRAVLRALRSGGRANAQLRVVATDESRLRTTRARYVKLVRPRRRRS